MVLLNSKKGGLGSPAADFSLKGVDNKIYTLSAFEEKKILVIIFMCNHCPYVKGVIGRFIEFQRVYSDKGVQVIGISPNDAEAYPEDSFDNMIKFSRERGMNFPYLYDESQRTAKEYDAVCTPDIYVYDESRLLKYRGRLDDNWQDEASVKSRDLKAAVDALLAGNEINFEQIPSMGCSIKWKNQ